MAGGDEAGGASNGGKGNGLKRTVKKDTIGIGRDVTEDGGVSYGQKTKIPSPSGRALKRNLSVLYGSTSQFSREFDTSPCRGFVRASNYYLDFKDLKGGLKQLTS